MAFTINPDSVSIEPTSNPLIFTMVCSVTEDSGVTYRPVSVLVNKNMKKEDLLTVISGKNAEKYLPIASAATYRDTLIKTTLKDSMVRPVSKPVAEPVMEETFKEV
jgi:predicted transcriptional regulator